jgi:ribosomal protein S18 acetylase RimI-like enzyme
MKYNNSKKEVTLHKLEKKYTNLACLVLSKAFKDDPFNTYAFPDPGERAKKMPYAYQFLLRYYISHGKCYITSSKVEGVAVWIHSDNLGTSSLRMITSGAIWPAMKMGMDTNRRMQVLSNYIEKKHRQLVPDKHWYLFLIGVDPKHQGKGYASQLLNGMLSEIDREGLPCYLETEVKKNAPIYRHFGFDVIDEFTIPNTNVNLIAMLRQPKRT